MSRLVYVLFLVPCLSFAQQEDDQLVYEEDHEEIDALASIGEVGQLPAEKEPCYCAYCGSSLRAQEEEVAVVEAKRAPTIGKKPRTASLHPHSKRPRVTHRKKEEKAPEQQPQPVASETTLFSESEEKLASPQKGRFSKRTQASAQRPRAQLKESMAQH
jgi:hypothetical protein